MNKNELCEKIREIYPDVGLCGINVNVDFDKENDRWTVKLKKGSNELKTFLEKGDAEMCLEGKQCVSLGLEISQLKDNVDKI